MKKYLSVLFALLLMISVLCGCAKDKTDENTDNHATATTPAATGENTADDKFSPENIVQIYMDNIDVWKHTSDTPVWYGYLFLDFNGDGVLELVKTTITGYEQKSNNTFYRVDTDTNTVAEIPFPDKTEDDQWDFNGNDYPDLYKNNATGEFRLMTSDYSRSDDMSNTTVIGELYMDENGNLQTRKMWSVDVVFENGDYSNATVSYNVFDEEGNKASASEEEYLGTLDKYEKENTNMLMEFKTVIGQGDGTTYNEDFASLDTDFQYNLLLESYKAYKY